jgi:ABC-type transport system involved in cytochrome c biogenesis permease subunit
MASAASYLAVVGTILVAPSFAAHVAHAVLVATGRRATVAAAQPRLSHAGVVIGSFAEQELLAMRFAAGVGYLVQGREDRFAWLPSHRTLDEVAYRAVVVGFPIFATMIVLGSRWASIAWIRWRGWDPKETAALVTWLAYAVYLHARNQRGWSGRPAALILVVGFLMVLVTHRGNLWFSGLHACSGLD